MRWSIMLNDIVGDVHGHADALENLLSTLGYEERRGAWRHPERHMVFLGDLIDRGPGQLRCVDVARRMRDAGAATVCMGNHEFNAIAWATEDGDGGHMRPRTHKNRSQHAAFLDAVGEDGPLHREMVDWFKSLPLWIERESFRAVHACWHEGSQAILRPHLDEANVLTEPGLRAVLDEEDEAYAAAEIVLKGLEVALPEGVVYRDKEGHPRLRTRIAWWDAAAETYRNAALVDPETAVMIPDDPLPAASRIAYGEGARPVFFGHYWLSGTPRLTSARMACLDWSVAKDGHLASYRHDGEAVLDPDRLHWVPATPVSAPTP